MDLRSETQKITELYDKAFAMSVEEDPDALECLKKDFIDLYQLIENPHPQHTMKYMQLLEEIKDGKLVYNAKGVKCDEGGEHSDTTMRD